MKKNALLIILLFNTISLFAQCDTPVEIRSIQTIDSIIYNLDSRIENKDTIVIYELNDSLFYNIIKKSNQKLHLAVFYVDWCKPCHESLILLHEINNSYKDLNIYFINPDKDKHSNLIGNHLKKVNLLTPTFILTKNYKGNVKNRFVKFRNQICSDCNKYLGFPTIILFNKSMEIILKKTGNINDLDKLLSELTSKERMD